MCKVMAYWGYYNAKSVKLVQFGKMQKITLLEEYKHHLETVCSVNVVVVFNISAITLVDLTEEAGKLFLVEFWEGKV